MGPSRRQLPNVATSEFADVLEELGPRFEASIERYQAGDHRGVWQELVSLGPDARQEPHAADALAVAYETMHRVSQNVRTLVRRLTGMGYVFTPDGQPAGSSIFRMFGRSKSAVSRAHVPPAPDAAQRVADFEKEFGTLALSQVRVDNGKSVTQEVVLTKN